MRLKAALSLVVLAALALSYASIPRRDSPGKNAPSFFSETH